MGRIDHDRLFKQLLKTYFRDFVELFFPEIAAHIDFSYVKFLSEEAVADMTRGGNRRVDILIETRLRGEKTLILIHIEPQSYYQINFPERMFIYAGRLFEKYRRRILPIAVFSHRRNVEEPTSFSWDVRTMEVLRFRYLALQLRKHNWREFVRLNNPVAAALLANMGYNKAERIQMSVEFLRMLARMRLEPEKMELIETFFGSYIRLNEAEEHLLQQEIRYRHKEEEAELMEFLLPSHRKAWKQARKDGRRDGRRDGRKEAVEEVATKLLEEGIHPAVIKKTTGLTLTRISQLRTQSRSPVDVSDEPNEGDNS